MSTLALMKLYSNLLRELEYAEMDGNFAALATAIDNLSVAGHKNAIINGNFTINQRAVSGTVTLAAGAYGHDRWKAGTSGCTYTFSTANNITTLTITAGSLKQIIEGVNLKTATYTLSWIGTAQGRVDSGSYGASGITASITGGNNTAIEFNTGTLALAQFEEGAVAGLFDFRPLQTELMLCQRYYRTAGQNHYGVTEGTTAFAISVVFDAPMRATPTCSARPGYYFNTRYAGDTSILNPTLANITADPSGVWLQVVSSGLTSGITVIGRHQGGSTLTGNFLGCDAEL